MFVHIDRYVEKCSNYILTLCFIQFLDKILAIKYLHLKLKNHIFLQSQLCYLIFVSRIL